MAHDALAKLVDMQRHPIGLASYRARCRSTFDDKGVLVLDGFIPAEPLVSLIAEAEVCKSMAYFSDRVHTVYLQAPDETFGADDARSHAIVSTKGAVTTDQLPTASALRMLYNEGMFREFLCEVLGEQNLYEYADPLSSINVNFYNQGQELGWHFDNSEFAVTLLLQAPSAGGGFEFIPALRDSGSDADNEREVSAVLHADGTTQLPKPTTLSVDPGALVLFRGRDALHRVTPVEGERGRILVVLAYNTEPGLSLSESARMTFFGRLQ